MYIEKNDSEHRQRHNNTIFFEKSDLQLELLLTAYRELAEENQKIRSTIKRFEKGSASTPGMEKSPGYHAVEVDIEQWKK